MKRSALCFLTLVSLASLPLPAQAHALPIALLHTPVPDPVMTSAYGMRTHPVTDQKQFHGAIDLRAKLNQPVRSSFDGVVKKAGPRGLLGNAVEVFHPNQNITTVYGHLNSVSVEPGQKVQMGEAIGLAGSTGRSTGVHVHLIVREGRTTKTLNPLVVLNDSSVPHYSEVSASTGSTIADSQGAQDSALEKTAPVNPIVERVRQAAQQIPLFIQAFAGLRPISAVQPFKVGVSSHPTNRPLVIEPNHKTATAPSRQVQAVARKHNSRTRPAAKSLVVAREHVTQRKSVPNVEVATETKLMKLNELKRAAEAASRDARNYRELLSEGIVSRKDAQRAQATAASAAAAVIACRNSTTNCT